MVNLNALHNYLKKTPIFKCASMSFHGWIPTYAILCWQGRAPSPICPRCQSNVETPDHVHICPAPPATLQWSTILEKILSKLITANTPLHVIGVFELKLSWLLQVSYTGWYKPQINISSSTHHFIIDAIWHQNIIGWHLFIKG